jgi:hypothetical protein
MTFRQIFPAQGVTYIHKSEKGALMCISELLPADCRAEIEYSHHFSQHNCLRWLRYIYLLRDCRHVDVTFVHHEHEPKHHVLDSVAH